MEERFSKLIQRKLSELDMWVGEYESYKQLGILNIFANRHHARISQLMADIQDMMYARDTAN